MYILKVTLGEWGCRGFSVTGGFTNPYLTSDGGLPRRVHFCCSAHKNSNNKHTCLDKGFGLGKLALGRVLGERVCVCLFMCVSVCLCVCLCVRNTDAQIRARCHRWSDPCVLCVVCVLFVSCVLCVCWGVCVCLGVSVCGLCRCSGSPRVRGLLLCEVDAADAEI